MLKQTRWVLFAVLLFGVSSKVATGGKLGDEPRGGSVVCNELADHQSVIESGSFSPDSRFLAVGHSDGKEYAKISIWDLNAKGWSMERAVHKNAFPFYVESGYGVRSRFLNYTFDGRRLVLFQGGGLRILDAATLVEQSHIGLDVPFISPDGTVRTAVWDMKVSPVENKVAVLIGGFPKDTSGLLRVYDLDTGRMTFEWKFEDDVNSGSISYSHDGKKIAATAHGTFHHSRGKGHPDVVILEPDSASVKLWLDTGNDGTGSMVFSGDNQLVVAPMWNERHLNRGAIKFWDVSTGKLTRQISDAPFGIHLEAEISRDGKILLGYTGKQKTIYHGMEIASQSFRLWELPSGRALADSPEIVPLADIGNVPQLRLSPDGRAVFAYWFAPMPIGYVGQVCEVALPGVHAEWPIQDRRK
jgi:WD40 repeat protein